jgi:S1-C subfamily serine protease
VVAGEDGASFHSVDDDSRAAKAGLKVGDRIETVDGKPLAAEEVGRLLRDLKPESKALLGIARDQEKLSIEVTRAPRGYLGIQSGSLPDEMRSSMGLPESEGVLIETVVPDSPADKAGLRKGDVLVRVAGYSVNRRTLVRRLARIGAGEKVTVQIVRDGESMGLPLTLGKPPTR